MRRGLRQRSRSRSEYRPFPDFHPLRDVSEPLAQRPLATTPIPGMPQCTSRNIEKPPMVEIEPEEREEEMPDSTLEPKVPRSIHRKKGESRLAGRDLIQVLDKDSLEAAARLEKL